MGAEGEGAQPGRGSAGRRRYGTKDPDLDLRLSRLVEESGCTDDAGLVFEMMVSVLRMGREGAGRADLKLVNSTLKELRYALSVFAPFADIPKCAVFGSARTPRDSASYEAARRVGEELVRAGWMIITGAGPGIMTAAVEGAGGDHTFGVSIRLPFEPAEAESLIPADRIVNFRYFFNRKLTFMKEASAYVVFPGGFGTMDETFELLTLLQTGKEPPSPVVLFEPEGDEYWRGWRDWVGSELLQAGLISAPDLDLFHLTSDPADAARYVTDFYRVFHSLRLVDGRTVLRLRTPISEGTLDRLNLEFADLLRQGRIERTGPTPAEVADDDVPDLPRLILDFDHAHNARLHALIRSLAPD